jgi:hypothetical protein
MHGKIVLAVLLLSLGTVAQAGVVYDNTGQASAGVDLVSLTGPLFDSFSVTAGGYALTDVKLLVQANAPADGGSFTVGLYADNLTLPGGLLTTIGTVNDLSVPSSLTLFDLTLATPYALTAGTTYWIGLAAANSSLVWSYDGNDSGTGVSGQYYAHLIGDEAPILTAFPASDGPYQMMVTDAPIGGGDGGSGVPEPSTFVLALIGGGILVARRRLAR